MGFNRGIIILVGGRKANRKPENMNKFSIGHVHLPRIFNQVRYLKTDMLMIKKKKNVVSSSKESLKKLAFNFIWKNSFFNFIGFRSYFCNFVGMLQLSPINPTIFDTECYLYISWHDNLPWPEFAMIQQVHWMCACVKYYILEICRLCMQTYGVMFISHQSFWSMKQSSSFSKLFLYV